MRRTASEVLRELEVRVARLERRASPSLHDENDFEEMLEDWSLEDLAEYFVARHFSEIPPYGFIRFTQQRILDKEIYSIGKALADEEQRPFMAHVDRLLGTTYREALENTKTFNYDLMYLANRRALNRNLSPEEIKSISELRDYLNNINKTGHSELEKVLKILAKKRRALETWKRKNL